jgi:hypothetical protein
VALMRQSVTFGSPLFATPMAETIPIVNGESFFINKSHTPPILSALPTQVPPNLFHSRKQIVIKSVFLALVRSLVQKSPSRKPFSLVIFHPHHPVPPTHHRRTTPRFKPPSIPPIDTLHARHRAMCTSNRRHVKLRVSSGRRETLRFSDVARASFQSPAPSTSSLGSSAPSRIGYTKCTSRAHSSSRFVVARTCERPSRFRAGCPPWLEL